MSSAPSAGTPDMTNLVMSLPGLSARSWPEKNLQFPKTINSLEQPCEPMSLHAQTQVPQPAPCKAAMATRKTSKPIVQRVMVQLCTHLDTNKLVLRRFWFRLASSNQVRARATVAVLDDVRYEGGQHERDYQAE